MSLSEPQIRRYARHILLPDVGGVGQARLLASAARLPVGPARPAAAVALAYLAAAGVGSLVVADEAEGDPIDEREVAGNILLGAGDAGRDRLDALRARLAALNPDVRVARDGEGFEGALDVYPDEPARGDVAAALSAGGAAAVRALVRLARDA